MVGTCHEEKRKDDSSLPSKVFYYCQYSYIIIYYWKKIIYESWDQQNLKWNELS